MTLVTSVCRSLDNCLLTGGITSGHASLPLCLLLAAKKQSTREEIPRATSFLLMSSDVVQGHGDGGTRSGFNACLISEGSKTLSGELISHYRHFNSSDV